VQVVRWLFVVSALGFVVFAAVQFDERVKSDSSEIGISSEFSGPPAELDTLHYQFRFPARIARCYLSLF
jgi:hypothetical protein